MLKNIYKCVLLLISVLIYSCEKEENPPVITFDSEGVSGIYAGDQVTVTGKISAGNSVSAYWFHRKLNEGGNLDEQTGGRLTLSSDGSFSIPIETEKTTFGVKVIAEDDRGNRSVKLFPIILGEDALTIAFEGNGYLESIETGEEFRVQGVVTSGTPITSLSYAIVKANLTEPAIKLDVTDPMSTAFDIALTARAGMTGIKFVANNRGMLTTERLFEIRQIIATGPTILFDEELISVKPDSIFTVTGQVISNKEITSVSYTVFREDGSDAPITTTLNNNTFSIDIVAEGNITAVAVTAIDSDNKDGEASVPVKVLFPERIETTTMIHYKYIILDDQLSRDKSYFSFDVPPYVLNANQAYLNYEKVQLLYTNLFISGQTYSGPALFTPNVSQGTTVNGKRLTTNPDWPVTAWGTFNVGRLQAIGMESTFVSSTGKTFDELDNLSLEEWDTMNSYLYNNGSMGSSGIVRQITTINGSGVGWMFKIGWGGSAPADFTRVAVGIVRGFGGEASSQEGESAGAWLEVEIKMSKNPIK